MTDEKNITLAGFGEMEEEADREQLAESAKAHGVKFEAGYYDHMLTGTPEAIEAITRELWSMPRDQWEENGLSIL